MENEHGCRLETDYQLSDKDLMRKIRRKLWWRELGVMVAENGTFVSFVLGMTSALKRRH